MPRVANPRVNVTVLQLCLLQKTTPDYSAILINFIKNAATKNTITLLKLIYRLLGTLDGGLSDCGTPTVLQKS